ncbi:MAG: hypothetical protein EPN45_05325 [Rhizobiaceae bacterium]|nr:MAG: hypothetical protein EPN45_05325 [Rhizobiaceae bacterium]
MTISKLMLAGLGALVGAAFMALPILPANAAANSVTTECSAKYKAAKSGGTLNGQKWPQFLKACSAEMKGDTAAANTAAAPKNEMKKETKAATHEKAPSCTAQYKTAKAGGELAGKTRKQFMADCKAGNTDEEAAVPPEPKSTMGSSNYKAATVDKNGKPLTPGQIAFRKRIHECSVEWHQAKDAGKIKAGQKWPQFWSACNTRLKGQQG